MASHQPTIDPQNFAKNAFTNFAPLLTLFGDELTKQFLSTSIAWTDIVLLGTAPLGIVTVIISAIRIGGNGLLKSFVGRTRESSSDEQKELLPSTSSTVREIWDGNRVVRQKGEMVTEIFVYDRTWNFNVKRYRKFTPLKDDLRFEAKEAQGYVSYKKLLDDSIAPSLTLNNPKAVASTRKTLGVLCSGLIIQVIVALVNALGTYRWHLLRAGSVVAPYGYPAWLAGTMGMSLGVAVCAYVSCEGTTIILFRPTVGNKHLRIFRVQKALDAEGLEAFIIPHESDIPLVRWPVTKQKQRPWLIAVGALFALAGFVCQNVGTRELHWSAGVLQLCATLILTGLRAFLRQHIGDELSPRPHKIRGSPACAVPIQLTERRCWSPNPTTLLKFTDKFMSCDEPRPGMVKLISSDSGEYKEAIVDIYGLLDAWPHLADLDEKDEMDELDKLADSLAKAMYRVLCKIIPIRPDRPFKWSHGMHLQREMLDNSASTINADLEIVPVEFLQSLESSVIRDYLKAIISFSTYTLFNRPILAQSALVLQVVGSFGSAEIESVAQRTRQFIPGRNVRFWPQKVQIGPEMKGRVSKFEIFGLQFSGLLAERYHPDYCDIVVEARITDDRHRRQHIAMDLFASFLRGVAQYSNDNHSNDFAEFVGKGTEAIDSIAKILVDCGICNEPWEGRMPVLSVILAHGIPLVHMREDQGERERPANE